MKRAETFAHAVERRLKVVQLLRSKTDASNAEIQQVYGDMLMSTQHMALLKLAVKQGLAHPERYSPKGLKERLRVGAPGNVRKLTPVPSAVDKLAGLKRFLDESVLPEMLTFVVGSEVQSVVITVSKDAAGHPVLTRRIGRAVMEWDEHKFDPAKEVENG